jgi:hypothetical protein
MKQPWSPDLYPFSSEPPNMQFKCGTAYSLEPFPSSNSLPSLEIKGQIDRRFERLAIDYHLSGDLKDIIIPHPVNSPIRQHELWEETCLEFFLGVSNSPQYWEINLSPTGDWNVYSFQDYRQGMQEEVAFSALPFRIQTQANAWQLDLEFDLSKIALTDSSLQIAICAVIKQINGEISYWALTHRGLQADFHRRDSFLVEL